MTTVDHAHFIARYLVEVLQECLELEGEVELDRYVPENEIKSFIKDLRKFYRDHETEESYLLFRRKWEGQGFSEVILYLYRSLSESLADDSLEHTKNLHKKIKKMLIQVIQFLKEHDLQCELDFIEEDFPGEIDKFGGFSESSVFQKNK